MLDATQTVLRERAPLAPGAPRTGPRVVAALLALVAAVGVHLTWLYFVATPAGQRVDGLAFAGAQRGQRRPAFDQVSVQRLEP